MAKQKLQVERALSVIKSDDIDIPSISNKIIESTTTGSTTGKLVDSSLDFLTDNLVRVGSIVYNTTSNSTATVQQVDDSNTLSLSSDIMSLGNSYEIFSEPTKDCMLYVGTSGDVRVLTSGGDDVIYKSVAVGFMPVHVKRVFETGTDATDIIANW